MHNLDLVLMSVSKKLAQTTVLYHYCIMCQFFFETLGLTLKVSLSQKILKNLFVAKKKHIPNHYLNKLFPVLGGKFKFSAQDSDLEYLFWQRKNSPVSPDLKPPLVHIRLARIDYLLPVFYVFGIDDRCFIFKILQFVSLTTQSKKQTKTFFDFKFLSCFRNNCEK